MLQDDFSTPAEGWNTGSDDSATIDFRDGTYAFDLRESDMFIWGNAGLGDLGDVHVKVTARQPGGGSDAGFGIICNYQDENAFHYLGINADGFFAIARMAGDEHVLLSSDTGVWEMTGKFTAGAAQYDLEANCGADGTLRLIVDGQEIASASDPQHATGGDVGLFVWSSEVAPVEVRFDDVVVTRAAP